MNFRDWNPFDIAARSARNRAAWSDVDQADSHAEISQQKSEVVDTDRRGSATHEAWKDRVARAAPAGALERNVQDVVLQFLALHPRVAWVYRMNVGGAEYPGPNGKIYKVRFAFPGCADIIGQLRDGRFLAVECKREIGGKVTEDQAAFLANVNRWGGCAFVARSVEDCVRAIG